MERRTIVVTYLLIILIFMGCTQEKEAESERKTSPSVVSSDFTPSNPNSSTPVEIRVTAISNKSPEFKWTVNGESLDFNRQILPPRFFSRGDTVFCSLIIEGEEKNKIGPIAISNSEPRIVDIQITPSEPVAGDNLRIEAITEDEEGDEIELRITWFVNETQVKEGNILEGNRIRAGDIVYANAVPYDGYDTGIEGTTDRVTVRNSPPEILSQPPTISGRTMDYRIRTEDPDGDSVSLQLETAPAGMRLENKRIIWEAPEVERDTSFTITITATDDKGGSTRASFDLFLERKKE